MGLNNREVKEFERLKRKSEITKLSFADQKRLIKLEDISNNSKDQGYVPKSPNQKYNLSWFHPQGKQQLYSNEIDSYDTVLVQAPSGCGKSSLAVWKGLGMLGKKYKHIMFIKTANESGDDAIGFLTGDADNKLLPHLKNMRNIFLDFMSVGQLESDEKNGNIKFEIPNYIQGGTFSDTYAIIDEAQNMSPHTIKLLLERFDDSCKVLVLGDHKQSYSIKKRPDGLTDLVHRVTMVDDNGERYCVEPEWTYVELPTSENQRGKRSRRVTELYGS